MGYNLEVSSSLLRLRITSLVTSLTILSCQLPSSTTFQNGGKLVPEMERENKSEILYVHYIRKLEITSAN